jgi:4,5-DOPA dioxygenase extradiol
MEAVLIVGSGNLVHNLHAYAWGGHPRDPYEWALRFEERAKDLILARKFAPLIEYEEMGTELSIPTPDHYLPLLYVLATGQASETAGFPINGVGGGSISMLTVKIG